MSEKIMDYIKQVLSTVPKIHIGVVAPNNAVDDITLGYKVGDQWLDTVTHTFYVCEDNTDGAAVWRSEVLT